MSLRSVKICVLAPCFELLDSHRQKKNWHEASLFFCCGE
jgi:hypothetical protein